MVSEVPNPPPPVTREEAGSALDRVLASAEFRQAPQLSAFLRYVVTETLAGRGDAVKGYAIATVALGRAADFDPQTDPIVRVQAGRLRRALATYYAEEGRDDPLEIVVERGNYAPVFRRRAADGEGTVAPAAASQPARSVPAVSVSEPEAAEAAAPRVRPAASTPPPRFLNDKPPPAAVAAPADDPPAPSPPVVAARQRRSPVWLAGASLALVLLAAGMLALRAPGPSPASPETSGLAMSTRSQAARQVPVISISRPLNVNDQPAQGESLAWLAPRLRQAIARFDDTLVLAEGTDVAPPGTAASARYAVVPRVIADSSDGVDFSLTLIHVGTGALLWTRDFQVGPGAAADKRAQDQLIRNVATTIAQPYGLLFAHARAQGAETAANGAGNDVHQCVILAFDFWRTYSNSDFTRSWTCIEQAGRDRPMSASELAILCYFHIEAHRQGRVQQGTDWLDAALDLARRAVAAAPTSARAHQALMAAHFIRREFADAITAGQTAHSLNPYDTDIMADLGARFIQLGQTARGLEKLEQALELNNAPPAWAIFFRFLGHYALDDRALAMSIGRNVPGANYALGMMARAIAAGQSQGAQSAEPVIAAIRGLHPRLAETPAEYLHRYVMPDELIDRLVADLRVAGL
jgi:tetratricopeptide (TPR) repeat protein